jgi:hypothetical protein
MPPCTHRLRDGGAQVLGSDGPGLAAARFQRRTQALAVAALQQAEFCALALGWAAVSGRSGSQLSGTERHTDGGSH